MENTAVLQPHLNHDLAINRIQTTPDFPIPRKREGYLYKRTDHFNRWQKRYFWCENNFLKFANDTKGTNLKIIDDLNEYDLAWRGKAKDKFVLTLTLREGFQRKAKKLVLASKDEGLARDWLQFFGSVMDAGPVDQGLRVRSRSSSSEEASASASVSRDSRSIDNSAEVIGETPEILQDIVNKKAFVRKRSFSLDAKQQCPVILKPPVQELTTQVKDREKENLEIRIETNQDTRPNTLETPIKPKFNYASLVGMATAGTEERSINKTMATYEFPFPKNAPKWVKDIFHQYIDGHSMWEAPLAKGIDANEWGIVHDDGKLRIMQSLDKASTFKCLYEVEGNGTVEKLLQVLIDVQNRNQWDKSFDSAVTLNYIPKPPQWVIRQVGKHKGPPSFFREFIYTRYVCKVLNTYFILDKSLEENQTGPSGLIDYSIMHITNQEGKVYLNIELSVSNGGSGSLESLQETQLALDSLMNLKFVQTVFSQYEDWDEFELSFIPTSDEHQETETSPIDIEVEAPTSAFQDNPEPEFSKALQEKPMIVITSAEETDVEKETSFKEEYKGLPDCQEACDDIRSVEEPDLAKSLQEKAMNGINSTEETELEKEIPLKEEYKDHKEVYEAVRLSEQPPATCADLNSLLEKLKDDLLTKECVDKQFLIRELTFEEISAIIEDSENDVLNGRVWKREPSSGLRFTDEEFLNKQKKILGHFLRNMGKNLLEGKSIMNVSMPVTIFSNESMLQRASASFAYAPTLLTLAGQQTDQLEAFKYVIAFYFSTLHTAIAQSKPFNPILGETYQGYLNGIPIECEQISHHPPVSAVFMKTQDFWLHGNQQLDASLGANSATATHKRRLCVTLERLGMHIYVYYPIATVSGTTFGKRCFNWAKKMKVYDPVNNLYCELLFNPEDKGAISNLFSKKITDADKAKGAIYKVKPEFMSVFHKKEDTINTDSRAKFEPKEHAIEELSTVEGSWISHLEIDSKKYWDNEMMKPFKLVDKPNKALPSDSNYREDLVYMKMDDLAKAQEAKDRLENIQRADKKSRIGKNKH